MPVTEDLELYAHWANICTVRFQNGYCYYGTYTSNSAKTQCIFNIEPTTINVACGTPLLRPDDPDSPISLYLGDKNNNRRDRDVYFSRWSTISDP
jgi:hypothetical protein